MRKLILATLLIPCVAQAQQAADDSVFIKKISDDIFTNGKAYEQLRDLTKNIGGRLAGSPQSIKAAHWGKKIMEETGADKVFFQECQVPHWLRGAQDKVTVLQIGNAQTNKALDVLALGNSYGSVQTYGAKGITAEVLAVADFAELEKRKDEVKGKIVYYNYAFNPTYVTPGQAYGETGVYRRNGASRAAKYGAVGVMIRSLTGSTDNNPHTGSMAYNDSFPKIPAVALGLKDADFVYNTAKKSPLKVSIVTHGQMLPDTVGYNVVAELKGTEFPNQYITIGGHLDSWDVNEGAHDDGTGVVQTIEILRVFKALGYKPKHTIRFVLFANEENGARGGRKYAELAKTNNEEHILAIETDEGGFTPRGFGFTLDDTKLQKIKSWETLLKPYGGGELENGGGGTDIEPLARVLKTPLAGFRPDNQRYFDIHHSRGDVFEAVNKRELLLGAVNIAALAYLVDKYGL
jgi:hypothetical protein